MRTYSDAGLMIAGEVIRDGRELLDVVNPATETTVGSIACATPDDLQNALDSADAAFRTWRAKSGLARGEILGKAGRLIRERLDAIASSMTLEQGKPLKQSRIEVALCAETFEWYAAEASRAYGRILPGRQAGERQLVLPQPIGPVAAFTPWNFPALLAARKIAAALAAGCSMILKPAEETPASAFALAEALKDAGLPNGVLNVVFGNPAAISEHLIRSKVIRKVSFTGSTPVGKQLAALAAEAPKPCTLELGGHAPVLVLEDADVAFAAKVSAIMKTFNAGQVCTSPTRFYAHRKVRDQFAELFAKELDRITLGDGMVETSKMGPLANSRRAATLDRLVNDAVTRGAEVLKGGTGRTSNAGYFWTPTILADVPDDADIKRIEPFGPVATLDVVDDLDEAIAKANATDAGLAAYAFTRSSTAALKVSEELEAGVVGINSFAVSNTEAPFSGIKDSGYGYEGGMEGLASYMYSKSVNHVA